MKWYFWVIIIVVVLLIIGYNTNWFGLKKSTINATAATAAERIMNSYKLTCMPNCKLSTDTKGAANTTTMNGIKYTCRCTDGATSGPIIVNN